MRDTDINPDLPRCFRWPVPGGHIHPNGTAARWRSGCYFPLTDLVVTDMGERGTGRPSAEGLEWVDDPPDGAIFGGDFPLPSRAWPRPGMGEMLGRPDGL